MSVTPFHKPMYKCECELTDCLHKWESDRIPDRCAACKRRTWNHIDKRHRQLTDEERARNVASANKRWANHKKELAS